MSDEVLWRPGDQPRSFCPGCEPETDQTREFVYESRCDQHRGETAGDMDHVMRSNVYLTATDIESETNRAWCALIHRPDA